MALRTLQRKCGCGGESHAGGECEECRRKRQGTLRRWSEHGAGVPEVPASVYETLAGAGRPLDRATREFMEPRFARDLTQVRVHDDDRASASAAAVGALAYTVGNDIVFGRAQYRPDSSAGRLLLVHELAHVLQQGSSMVSAGELAVEPPGSSAEREAEAAAREQPTGRPRIWSAAPVRVQRAAIHSGNILEEGSCEHLACNSKWACEDPGGITCPKGTRNASETKKFRPLFTCDAKCENGRTCDDADTWMAIPKSRFTSRKKCGQDLVICANNTFVHGYVRDRSEREAWEVSPGIQAALGISGGSFSGAIYPDEGDAQFKKDARCRPKPEKKEKGEEKKKGEKKSSLEVEGETEPALAFASGAESPPAPWLE